MINTIAAAITIPPAGGDQFDFEGLGVHWKIDGLLSEGRFAIVHHPLAPRALAAPVHFHHNEDELSYVLRGKFGALLGDDVVTATPGTWVYKPRQQWHYVLERRRRALRHHRGHLAAGFEHYFREVAASWGDASRFAEINRKYALDMRFESVPELCTRFGLTFPDL